MKNLQLKPVCYHVPVIYGHAGEDVRLFLKKVVSCLLKRKKWFIVNI